MSPELNEMSRLLLAGVLGALLGAQRELSGHPAGFRTHILVAIGACLFTLAGVWLARAGPGVVDSSRIASQVVVGIGFLGGGSIVKEGLSIRGLTTAANLWVTASIGLAAGAGMFLVASFATALVFIALVGLVPVERAIRRRRAEHGAPPEQLEG